MNIYINEGETVEGIKADIILEEQNGRDSSRNP